MNEKEREELREFDEKLQDLMLLNERYTLEEMVDMGYPEFVEEIDVMTYDEE